MGRGLTLSEDQVTPSLFCLVSAAIIGPYKVVGTERSHLSRLGFHQLFFGPFKTREQVFFHLKNTVRVENHGKHY